jgi:hypothetical protein
MPKPPRSDKNIRANLRHGARNRRGADSVKGLLARPSPVLASITDQAARQASWRRWLDERLPAPLPARITGIVERDGVLVLYAESAGWGVRLRYALAELEAQLRGAHPAISRITVRVLPRRSAP